MLTLLIVMVAILSLVGSVVWVRPSKRDVKLAKWRQEARQAGMYVKLDGLAAEPKDSGIRDDIGGASYYLYEPQAHKQDQLSWALVKAEGWLQQGLPARWSWYRQEVALDGPRLQALIAALPIAVDAIERTPKYSRIIWQESGQEFDAQQLKQFLQQVQALA
ncbi:MAG: hypothetical protein RPR98_08655 [Bermanella sp.]